MQFVQWPKIDELEINEVTKVLKSGKLNFWTGSNSINFEKEFRDYFNLNYCSTIANGSLALDCAMSAINLKKGDEVIVTPRSYMASVSCIINAGAKPIFADIDINSHNITSKTIEPKITKKTKAIICVHIAGYPTDVDKIKKLANKNKLFLIEDCSQAHGAKIKDKYAGSFGDISVWSFCNDKIISTGGEGGMISAKNKKLYNKILSLKDCGKNFNKIKNLKNDIGFKWVHDSIGTNMRMTEIQSSLGRIQLKKLKKMLIIRNINAKYFFSLIKNTKGLIVPKIPSNIYHSFYRTMILIDLDKIKKNWNRNKIIINLKKNNIQCSVGSCPEIYREKYFLNNKLFPKKILANTVLIGNSCIAFDFNHLVSKKYVKRSAFVLKNILKSAYKND